MPACSAMPVAAVPRLLLLAAALLRCCAALDPQAAALPFAPGAGPDASGRAPWGREPDALPLTTDDECDAGGGSAADACALSALQRRGAGARAGLAAPARAAGAVGRQALKILFVGNSFTYGPPPVGRADTDSLNNLPRMFKFVAESLGHQVAQMEDTIGGCSLFMHRPSQNPEACTDPTFCKKVHTARVNESEGCTVPAGIRSLSAHFAPCPQRLLREEFGTWDVVVLQDASSLPTIQKARELMFYPAVNEFALAVRRLGAQARKRQPVIALYMTWAYYEGSHVRCPGGGKPGCWPLGEPHDLTDCANNAWFPKVQGAACQAYSLARGIAEGLNHGADVLVPAGLAWQTARGAPAIPDSCKSLVDKEYSSPGPLASLDLPLRASNSSNARWEGQAAHSLFRDMGPKYKSRYCADGCHHDHHASAAAQYLNALVFFATLLRRSPIGAAWPNGTSSVDGMVLPAVSAEDAQALQHIAHDVVMGHLDVWWKQRQQQLGDDP